MGARFPLPLATFPPQLSEINVRNWDNRVQFSTVLPVLPTFPLFHCQVLENLYQLQTLSKCGFALVFQFSTANGYYYGYVTNFVDP